MVTPTEELLHTSAGAQWAKIGAYNHHGICIPLFSLHSQKSSGIGEYPDLMPIIDFCADVGLDIIQLLPLNDTGRETSPYAALSANALNPVHLGLTSLPYLNEYNDLQDWRRALQERNKDQRIEYQGLFSEKEKFLTEYCKRVKDRVIQDPAYQKFLQENSSWLPGYSLYKVLKWERGLKSWENWEEDLHNPDQGKIASLLEEKKDKIIEHQIIQYFCTLQMHEAKEHAEKKGVFIKGDIPILINRDSADVWLNRSIFNMELCAGAPPDMFSDEGQNWGVPLYNWDVMASGNYEWWRLRLKIASRYYHIYRIDHIVGFFRIWAMAPGQTGKYGKFIPEHNYEWIPHGEKLMRMMLEAAPILPIGEDLGVVPTEVRICLSELGICGTKVVRWERRWNEDRGFIDPKDYSLRSMTTISTHDSETLLLWWKNNPEEAKEYCKLKGWEYTPDLPLDKQFEMIRETHHSGSLFHVNLLQEYLALIPDMTWPNPEDERINIPGFVLDRNWSYKFKPSVETMVNSKGLKDLFISLLN